LNSPLIRVLFAGAAASAAWCAGIAFVFGPFQGILANPEYQSAKFLAAFTEPPLPRVADNAAVLPLGILCIGMIHALVYAWLEPKLRGPTWQKGASFGMMSWALMVPWFEFYLPWNVMREPFPLVLLEGFCWLVVLLAVGVSMAFGFAGFRRRGNTETGDSHT
jgi:hypothetical protein